MSIVSHISHCLVGCAIATVFTACSLDEEPRDQIPEKEAFTNANALFRNTVATLYYHIGSNTDGQGLQGTGRGVYDLQTFGSDEAMIPTRGGDWYDGGMWQAMYKHSWAAGHELPKNAWLYLYKVITLCNRSLETLEKHQDMAGDHYIQWCAEVRALRAMYYWYLIDLFGDVPLIVSTNVSMNEVTRAPRAEVFNFCVKELEANKEELPFANSVRLGDFYGRITMPVAIFVLAKLYLNAAVYTGKEDVENYKRCVECCTDIEDMGYGLEDNYSNNFLVNNQYSKENIFVIPMNKYLYTSQQHNMIRSYHYHHSAVYGYTGENGICATKRAMQIFGYGTPEEDRRMLENFFYGIVYDLNAHPVKDRTGKFLTYYPEAVELDLSRSPYLETAGARMRKYEIDPNAPLGGKLIDNDIVLFRFADVLLMRAEAKLRMNEDGHKDFDTVRERANMPTRPYTLQNLLDERMLELCWEGWRRQDLIRFGQFKSLYDGPEAIDESVGHTCLYPIPADVRALNKKLTQNEGY